MAAGIARKPWSAADLASCGSALDSGVTSTSPTVDISDVTPFAFSVAISETSCGLLPLTHIFLARHHLNTASVSGLLIALRFLFAPPIADLFRIGAANTYIARRPKYPPPGEEENRAYFQRRVPIAGSIPIARERAKDTGNSQVLLLSPLLPTQTYSEVEHLVDCFPLETQPPP